MARVLELGEGRRRLVMWVHRVDIIDNHGFVGHNLAPKDPSKVRTGPSESTYKFPTIRVGCGHIFVAKGVTKRGVWGAEPPSIAGGSGGRQPPSKIRKRNKSKCSCNFAWNFI